MKKFALFLIFVILAIQIQAEMTPRDVEFLLNQQEQRFEKYLGLRDNYTESMVNYKSDELYIKIREDANKILIKMGFMIFGSIVAAFGFIHLALYLIKRAKKNV